jgi:hypothetical protein
LEIHLIKVARKILEKPENKIDVDKIYKILTMETAILLQFLNN